MTKKKDDGVLIKLCRICGDRAVGFNFNVLTCDSCKLFFRRHMLQDKPLFCRNDTKCSNITIENRKNCKHCRMEKCLEVGMKREFIFSRFDRLNKSRLKNVISPIKPPILKNIPQTEISLVKSYQRFLPIDAYGNDLLDELRNASSVINYKSALNIKSEANSVIEVLNIAAHKIQQVIHFCRSITAFRDLASQDQLNLLKQFYPYKALIRNAFLYCPKKSGFPVRHCDNSNEAVFIHMKEVQKNLTNNNRSRDDYNQYLKFICSLNTELESDCTIQDLILAQLLFKSRNPNQLMTNSTEHMFYHRNVYQFLLKRYLEDKFDQNANKIQYKLDTLNSLIGQVDVVCDIIRDGYARADSTQLSDVVKEIYSL